MLHAYAMTSSIQYLLYACPSRTAQRHAKWDPSNERADAQLLVSTGVHCQLVSNTMQNRDTQLPLYRAFPVRDFEKAVRGVIPRPYVRRRLG